MLGSFLAGLAGVLYMSQRGPQKTLLGVIIITWIQSGLLMMGTGRDIQVVILGLIAIVMTIATTERGKLIRAIVK